MDNLPKDMQREINELTLRKPRPPKRSRGWTLMLVGDRGKVISIDRFKGVIVALMLLLIVVVTTAIGFYILYHGKIRENLRLQGDLESTRQKLISLREEKDLLMVRLVLKESNKRPDPSQTVDNKMAKPPEKIESAGKSDVSSPLPSESKTETLKPTPKAQDNKEPSAATNRTIAAQTSEPSPENQKPQIVNVENVVVQHDKSNNRLTVTFLLKKIEADTETISGRAFVTLQQERTDPKQWLTMPSSPLVSGKPSQISRGQYFSIARLKPMKFDRIIAADQSRYQYAVIHIFSTTGELLLEKGVPVKVQERTAATGE